MRGERIVVDQNTCDHNWWYDTTHEAVFLEIVDLDGLRIALDICLKCGRLAPIRS